MVNDVSEGMEINYADGEWLASRGILTITNRQLQYLNELVGRKIPGAYRTYHSADSIEEEETSELRYPVELLNSIPGNSSLPEHNLQLEKGFLVMLLRNLDPKHGHVNGARYIVDEMLTNVLKLTIAVD